MQTFGERLKELRKQAHLSRQELADALNLTVRTISAYENNQCGASFETLYKASKIFSVSPQYLSGETDIKTLSEELLEKNKEHENNLKQQNKYITYCLNDIYEMFERFGADEAKGRALVEIISEINSLSDFDYSFSESIFKQKLSKVDFVGYRNSCLEYQKGFLNKHLSDLTNLGVDDAYKKYLSYYEMYNDPEDGADKLKSDKKMNEEISFNMLKNHGVIDHSK